MIVHFRIIKKCGIREGITNYKATYDLVLVVFRLVKNFTKEYKYTLGESIKKEAIEVVEIN